MKRFSSSNPKNKEVIRRPSAVLHPLLQGPQNYDTERCIPLRSASKHCLTDFTRRVMSGKLLQLRQYQNLLNEAQQNLQTALNENKSLIRLLKRHESSLKRYEGEEAGMPRLLRAHAEEVKALKTQIQQLRKEVREAQIVIREKDSEVTALRDVVAKLKSLVEQKSLLDIEKANKKIIKLEAINDEQHREILNLKRRILLETKTNQRMVDMEVAKHKETKVLLQHALETIENLEKQKRIISMGYTPLNGIKHHECSLVTPRNESSQIRRGSLVPLSSYSVRKSSESLGAVDPSTSIAKNPSFKPHKLRTTPII